MREEEDGRTEVRATFSETGLRLSEPERQDKTLGFVPKGQKRPLGRKSHPSNKALARGRMQVRLPAVRLTFLFKACDLWRLSRDFAQAQTIIKLSCV